MKKTTTMMKAAALVLTLGLVAGCATTADVQSARDAAARAQETADAAMKAARAAELDAASAQGSADAAMSKADDATAAAKECNERCSRMSEKGMADAMAK